jgi:uncharacterized protein (TIGR02996 family)
MKTTRQTLEEALADGFEDVLTHHAYADLLDEEGDPRGELVRVQLALEDRALPAERREGLKAREEELFRAHGDAWLGALAPLRVPKKGPGGARPNCQYTIRRGWVRSVSLLYLDLALIAALRACPLARLLSWLSIPHVGEANWTQLPAALEKAHFLYTLQTLELADVHDPLPRYGMDVTALVRLMPCLEQLFLCMSGNTAQLFAVPLPRLRELHVRYADQFALAVLGNNWSLGKLEELSLESPNPLEDDSPSPITLHGLRAVCRSPHLKALTRLSLRRTDFGDDGVRELIDSGLFRRLTELELPNGAITDEGARLLAAQPGLSEMEVDLRDNALTEEGVALVEAAGEDVHARDQHEPGTTDYLYEFDME